MEVGVGHCWWLDEEGAVFIRLFVPVPTIKALLTHMAPTIEAYVHIQTCSQGVNAFN